ncbi:three-helix bundle dimerization domain-containing protein [Kineosporia babensis]|uniref:Uncharacterized protein n=1 Tax=Kineosporia babensis TaxID=499548 RepID=A0A9X1NG26_9ACTN|nr:hypothetical protein [Kineosporia babensis]MCD5313463.1 hypothetical protein [Kineosporia babensis]
MPEPEVQAIVAELSVKYPLFAAATIQRWVQRETARYADAPVTTFVPILVRRAVERTLRDLDTIEAVDLNNPNPNLQLAR